MKSLMKLDLQRVKSGSVSGVESCADGDELCRGGTKWMTVFYIIKLIIGIFVIKNKFIITWIMFLMAL